LLVIARSSFSISTLIGILMLMGIAAKNSILLVEYAIMAMKEHGMTKREAIIDAAHKRARPILMTTVAMGAGMAPVALGFGADVEFRAPMAIAVIGGLITSTLLSLLYVPVVFVLMDGLRTRAERVTHRMFGRGAHTAHPGPAQSALVD
ncbi:MAG TPA: efflux RND transporter permease subunit, partial [Caulobacter sp.]|nr:efflux RND transporter permease subunit [Caulobacter sp.]